MNGVAYQNIQTQQPLGYPYAIRNGHYLTCGGSIIEMINGIETKRNCGTTLTCYGDKRDTDKVDGRNLCYRCYRQYYKNKGKETRELAKKTKGILPNTQFNGQNTFIGLMPPEYQQQSYIPNTLSQQQYDHPSLHSKYVETGDDYGFNIDNTSDEEKSKLKLDFEKLMEAFKLQQVELGNYRREMELLKEKHESLQSNFEAAVIASQSIHQKIEDKHKENELNRVNFEKRVTDEVSRILKEKEKFIMESVSNYVTNKCVLKTTI